MGSCLWCRAIQQHFVLVSLWLQLQLTVNVFTAPRSPVHTYLRNAIVPVIRSDVGDGHARLGHGNGGFQCVGKSDVTTAKALQPVSYSSFRALARSLLNYIILALTLFTYVVPLFQLHLSSPSLSFDASLHESMKALPPYLYCVHPARRSARYSHRQGIEHRPWICCAPLLHILHVFTSFPPVAPASISTCMRCRALAPWEYPRSLSSSRESAAGDRPLPLIPRTFLEDAS